MGSKRSYDGQEPLQLPYKYSKQFATGEKLISFTDEKLAPLACMLPCNDSFDKLNIPVGHNGQKAPRLVDTFEIQNIHEVQNVVDRGLVDGLRFSWIADSHGDDHSWCRDLPRYFLPDYFESNSPRREPVYVGMGSALSSFLDHYSRKHVPVGANHQVDLPERESPKMSSSRIGAPNSDQFLTSDEEKQFMGTCVIPMPDSSLPAQNSLSAGAGRKDCDCVDRASVRCVRQHVREARDKLLNALGEDKFRELGFVDMGEAVARKWSEEEEQVFHEVVFSNPASLSKDFWSCLSKEFPTRSVSDLVSYYFNVFMLRKRAAQNRSPFLDTDSDDDEWQQGHGRSYGIGFAGEDDDSVFYHDEDSSDDSDDQQDTDSADADVEESSQPNVRFLHKESDLAPVNHDDSCISFKYPSAIEDSAPTKTCMPTREVNGLKNNDKYFSSNQTESGDGLNPGCSDDSSNFRHWDQGFSAGLDHLLPTQNMIEEIFGPGSWENKPNHD